MLSFWLFYREIDEKISVLRERLKREAEERMAERRKSWHQFSSQLQARARDAARLEMDELRRELQEEEHALRQQLESKIFPHPK